MKIGSHVSMSGGLIKAAKEANSYGANTFMIYTGAPQNTKRSPIEKLKIEEGKDFMAKNNISDIVVHAPYIINLASYKEDTYSLAIDFLKQEIERTTAIGSDYIVLHPGSFTDKTLEYGIERIANGLNQVLTKDTKPFVCLETMAGKGSEIGRNFEELKAIIEIIHINGSLNKCGAKKDRHANLGADETNPKGKDFIGFDAIYNIVHSNYLKNKIFILETPWIDSKTNLYKEEIERLRG